MGPTPGGVWRVRCRLMPTLRLCSKDIRKTSRGGEDGVTTGLQQSCLGECRRPAWERPNVTKAETHIPEFSVVPAGCTTQVCGPTHLHGAHTHTHAHCHL